MNYRFILQVVKAGTNIVHYLNTQQREKTESLCRSEIKKCARHDSFAFVNTIVHNLSRSHGGGEDFIPFAARLKLNG